MAFLGSLEACSNGEINMRDSIAVAFISDGSSSFSKITPDSCPGAWRQLFLLLSLPLLGTCCLGHFEIETETVKCEVLQGGCSKAPRPSQLRTGKLRR